MVKIRLRRVGAKKQPSYRVVVADSRSPRDGRFIEIIGSYNPRTEPETVKIKEDRALYWLNVGAQSSEAVARLLKQKGTMARLERLKQGEPLEALVAEAEEEAQAQSPISPKTLRDHTTLAAEEPETAEIEEKADAEEQVEAEDDSKESDEEVEAKSEE